jgi:hypothetical protein
VIGAFPYSWVAAAFFISVMPGPAHAFCSVLDGRPCAPSFCSVLDAEPCIPDYGTPLGQGLRLTVQTRSTDTPPAASHEPLNTIQDVFAALRACWLPPAAADARRGTEITVVLSFTRAGEILGEPRFTYFSRGLPVETRAAYQRAVADALKRCAPLPFTPKLGGALAGRPISIRFIDAREFRRPEKST